MFTKESWTYAKRCLVQGPLFRLWLPLVLRFLFGSLVDGSKVLCWGDIALVSGGFVSSSAGLFF